MRVYSAHDNKEILRRKVNGLKYLKEFGIIILVSFLGELLKYYIPLPIPASIYGLLLMLAALKFHVIALDAVRETGNFMVEIMAVMFIPAAVGIMQIWDILKPIWQQLVVVVVVSTVVVMAVSGRVTQAMIRRGKK